MPRALSILLVVLASSVSVSSVQAQSLEPDDFARGVRLDAVEGEAVQVALLPLAVYQTATRPDLGDMRVFNGDGEVLPHALYRSGVPRPVHPIPIALPLFPVRGQADTPVGDLTVQWRRTDDGTLVQVRRGERTVRVMPVRAYVLDATQLDAPIQRLTFTWADTTQNVLVDVEAETSEDLQSWRSWGRATLARMRYEGQVLSRNEMALPQRTPRYIRLSWPGGNAMPPLERVEATLDAEAEPRREWLSVEAATPEAHLYRFDGKGVLPVDRVEVALPQPNTLARVEIASADTEDGPWTTRYDGLVYRLQVEGRELTTPPIIVEQTTDRHWRMEVDPAGGGLGRSAPTLRLGWTPERLLFVARGAPPYLLAVGGAGVEPADFSAREILRLLPGPEEDVLDQPRAAVVDVVDLGGPSRLSPDEETPWARYLLWGALVLGVVLLTVFAARLIRQIDADRGEAARNRRADESTSR